MIQGLIDRVGQTRLPEKDTDAEHLLQTTLGQNPDALYILSQTVLVQKYALEQAQRQLADLKSQLDQSRQQPPPAPEHHTSFLGSLLGRNDPPPPPPPSGSSPQYAPVPNYQPGYTQPGYPSSSQFAPQPGSPSGIQSGGFLRGALQTASGVAAGALAFEGIESLMHGFGGGGGGFGGGQGLGGFGGGGPREEVVNNYYGDSGDRDNGNLSPDIEDRRDDAGSNSADSFADTGAGDYGNPDDTGSSFDSGSDDNSGSDDSSSFDSGSDDSSFS